MHFFLWFFFFLSALVWKEAEGKEIHDVKLLIMRKTLFAIIYLTDFFYALKFISSDLYVFTPFRRESRWNTANWFSRGYVGKLLRGCVKEKQCAFPFQLFFLFSFFLSVFLCPSACASLSVFTVHYLWGFIYFELFQHAQPNPTWSMKTMACNECIQSCLIINEFVTPLHSSVWQVDSLLFTVCVNGMCTFSQIASESERTFLYIHSGVQKCGTTFENVYFFSFQLGNQQEVLEFRKIWNSKKKK